MYININNSFDVTSKNKKDLIINDLKRDWTPGGEYLEHKNVSYKLNSYGYRGKEFKETADIMTLGCSFTFGVGLPEEKMWANILANKLEMSLVNLGFPGDSTMGQIRKAFSYFKKFGNPKIIVCLFPLNRIEMPIDENFLFPHYMNKGYYHAAVENIEILPGNVEKYSKIPHDPTKVLTPDVAVYYTHMMIAILEQYCNSNNIKFVWSIWEHTYPFISEYIGKENQEIYKNFCENSFIRWTNVIENGVHKEFLDKPYTVNCHQEHADDFFFYSASDTLRNNPHAGFHKNIHLAENFLNFINGED